jgi:hypothetical protein
MASFLFYSKPDSIGDPVPSLGSNQFDRVRPGDELWAVTTRAGDLFLQAHVMVSVVVGKADAERLLGKANLWDAASSLLQKRQQNHDATST